MGTRAVMFGAVVIAATVAATVDAGDGAEPEDPRHHAELEQAMKDQGLEDESSVRGTSVEGEDRKLEAAERDEDGWTTFGPPRE